MKWFQVFVAGVFSVSVFAACGGDDTAKGDSFEEDTVRAGETRDNNRAIDEGEPDPNTEDPNTEDPNTETPDDLEVDRCTPGDVAGCADETHQRICNDEGNAFGAVACPSGENCLAGECTTDVCIPGVSACEGGESVKICNSDGSGYEPAEACPEDTVCNAGSCKSICELGKYRSSYIGCEYWTVDLDQHPDPTQSPKPNEIPHAVVISNPNNNDATIAFYSQVASASVQVADPVVPARSARAFEMPRLDVSGTSLTKRAINIVSSSPVSMHQFNPLNNENVYSNDASLLLPVNVVGKEYYVVNWPTQILPAFMGFDPPDQHAYVTIVAVEQGTTALNVTSTAQIEYGDGVGAVAPGFARGFSMNRGEVLNLQAKDPGGLGGQNDLTGTHIIADKNIIVFAGHEAAVIGEPGGGNNSGNDPGGNQGSGNCCADHLEQQLFPVNSLGTSYIAPHSPSRGVKKDHWRIVAAETATITTDPPQAGADGVTLEAGEFVKIWSDESFEVNATGKIMVAQFLVSQQRTTAVTGDPAMVLAVPNERFRSDYAVLTPDGYDEDWLTVIRPAGVEVRLAGQPISAQWQSVGTYEVGHVAVTPGVQNVESDEPFGLIAYGFDTAVSYAYPGGLDLVGASAE